MPSTTITSPLSLHDALPIFATADVESLPYAAGTFDVVLSTVMLHHLSNDARLKCIGEVRRVLKPGGRFVALDFGGAAAERRTRRSEEHTSELQSLRHLVCRLPPSPPLFPYTTLFRSLQPRTWRACPTPQAPLTWS